MPDKVISRSKFILVLFALTPLLWVTCSGSDARKEALEAQEALKQEVEFGRLLAFKIIRKYPLLEDKEATLYVSKVGKSVALFGGRADIEYHFGILDTDVANAYACPGGYIFVTKGALKAMQNEAELAGVLGHEIAHVNLKHIMKELPPPRDTRGFVDRLAAVLSAQGTAVSAGMSAAAEKAAELLFSKGLKQKDEYEADQTATAYLAATGYQPNGLSNFLGVLRDLKGEKDNASYNTHPSLKDRIERLRTYITQEGFETKRPALRDRFVRNLKHLKN